ncbi:hypothetical protein [Nocardia sp. NPDC020380]|uniref:hypothetical protein n=1 Tax=Nocardia sp. NPDC020380 TaxID=3364309 RepID=UPI0037B6589E
MTENAPDETPPQAEPSAANAARDQLLYAIADEAGRVAASQPGNASGALVELARTFALVTGEGARSAGFDGQVLPHVTLRDPLLPWERKSAELVVIPAAQLKPDTVGELHVRATDDGPGLVLTGGHAFPQSLEVIDDSGNLVATYIVAGGSQPLERASGWVVHSDYLEPSDYGARLSAATVAHDQLLNAIAEEAMSVAASQPGTASAALGELARAYALVTVTPRVFQAGGQKVGLCLELEP